MLRRIILFLCLASAAQVMLPVQGNASVSQSTLFGNADHLPKHILNHLLKKAAQHWDISFEAATQAYRHRDLILTETSDDQGNRAVLIEYSGGNLLEIIQDML